MTIHSVRSIRAGMCFSIAIALGLYMYTAQAQTVRVSFLDIGQGDAILIQTQNGVQILIDGGKDETVLRRLSTQLPLFDRSIDAVIATHPDADHVGGLPGVIARYKVARVFYTPMKHDTPQVTLFERALLEKKITPELLRAGDTLMLDNEVFLHILHPASVSDGDETNDSSVVAKLVHRNTSFMLTGDASVDIEYSLATQYGTALKSSVLKLGHHGSYTSTSDIFLGFVRPEYALISRGCDNEYGHPHKEVIERLSEFQIPSLDTCLNGSVTFESTGDAFTVSYK